MTSIRAETDGEGVCVLTFDRPDSSANVFDRATLEELDARIDQLGNARALVLASAKDSIFIAGADLHSIKSMDGSDLQAFIELGQRVFGRIAALPIPTVAAIHGAALGGGYEVCLACDWRVASPENCTKIGLPETKLGIVPGWGGCTRLPRLIGVAKALDMILGGKTVPARRARQLGMIDDIAPREYLLNAARKLLLRGKRPPRKMALRALDALLRPAIAQKVRSDVRKKTGGHYPAIEAALDVIIRGGATDQARSLALERQAVGRLIGHPATQNLLRLFFLQERAKKLAPRGAAAPAQTIERTAVIGAGIMGAGIAQWLSARGLPVILRDIDPARVAAGMAGISRAYSEAVKRRLMTPIEARRGSDRVEPAHSEVSLQRVQLVIEAAVEKMEVKKTIFRQLDALTVRDAILATNTSALSISELAAATQHPGRVIGIHFFNPVHKMQLVEVVTGAATAAQTTATAVRFVQRIGKLPVVVKDSPGFLVNRVLLPYMLEASALCAGGVTVDQIDRAMLQFGMPMGPLRLIDEVGVDIAEDVARTLSVAFPDRFRVPQILGKLIERKMLGRKSGQGFYLHRKGRKTEMNPAIAQFQENTLRPSTSELQERMVFSMINEAARVLLAQVVDSPADVDFAMVMGTGFAPFRGGPLRYADSIGTAKVKETLERLSESAGAHFRPSEYLEALNGKPFYADE